MTLPCSRKLASRLGHRLADGGPLSPDEQSDFELLMGYFDEHQGVVRSRIVALVSEPPWSDLDLKVTGRTKTTGTLRDKLRRSPEIKLPYVRDIAGVRVVGDLRLSQQDSLASSIAGLFGQLESRTTIDRRATPISGYRALHEVVRSGDARVEVQIRTDLQAVWADLFERQADQWGRGARYGQGPEPDADGNVAERISFLEDLMAVSTNQITEFERVRDSHEPTPSAKLAELDAEFRQLLRRRTSNDLRKATRMKVAIERIRRADDQIAQILEGWANDIRVTLDSLADRAESIK